MSIFTPKTVEEKIKIMLENNGIAFEDNDDGDTDIDVTAMDSITFISFIIDVEDTFEIALPDELLSIEILQSLSSFANIVYELVNEKKETMIKKDIKFQQLI